MKKSTSRSEPKVRAKPQASSTAKSNGSVFSVGLVQEFSDFMKAQDLVELDLEEGGRKLRLRRGSSDSVTSAPVMSAKPAAVAPAPVAAAPSAPAKEIAKKYQVVSSPFVGTFYRSQGPNQDAFVEEGRAVNVGDTLCIIEAMKLMNEIESDVKGRIVRVCVKNGTPVEFGEPLFEVDPG